MASCGGRNVRGRDLDLKDMAGLDGIKSVRGRRRIMEARITQHLSESDNLVASIMALLSSARKLIPAEKDFGYAVVESLLRVLADEPMKTAVENVEITRAEKVAIFGFLSVSTFVDQFNNAVVTFRLYEHNVIADLHIKISEMLLEKNMMVGLARAWIVALNLIDIYLYDHGLMYLMVNERLEQLEVFVTRCDAELRPSVLKYIHDFLLVQGKTKGRSYGGKLVGDYRTLEKMLHEWSSYYAIPLEDLPRRNVCAPRKYLKSLIRETFVTKTMTLECFRANSGRAIRSLPALEPLLVRELILLGRLAEANFWAEAYGINPCVSKGNVSERVRDAALPGEDPNVFDGSGGEKCYSLTIPETLSRPLITVPDICEALRFIFQNVSVMAMSFKEGRSGLDGGGRDSLLTVAVKDRVFLIDLMMPALRMLFHVNSAAQFRALMLSDTIVKLGFGIRRGVSYLGAGMGNGFIFLQARDLFDFKAFLEEWEEYAAAGDFQEKIGKNAVEILFGGKAPKKDYTLSDLARIFLGTPLHPGENRSSWESRPLRDAQVVAACADAYVLLDLHEAWSRLAEAAGCPGAEFWTALTSFQRLLKTGHYVHRAARGLGVEPEVADGGRRQNETKTAVEQRMPALKKAEVALQADGRSGDTGQPEVPAEPSRKPETGPPEPATELGGGGDAAGHGQPSGGDGNAGTSESAPSAGGEARGAAEDVGARGESGQGSKGKKKSGPPKEHKRRP